MRPIIISHRGYWKTAAERNTATAFRRSFELRFGTETDLRDHQGLLVISHDPADNEAMPFKEFLSLLSAIDTQLPLAINIKSDGLQKLLIEELRTMPIPNWFAFDMSIPDMLGYQKSGLPFYTRQSEIEPEPVLYEGAKGVWIDCFFTDWISEQIIVRHSARGKDMCLVSPDLHKREYSSYWNKLRDMTYEPETNILLCTDYPEEARDFFMAKIRAILFDMDGVLIDARDWHYEALNRALGLFGMEISRYDHLVTYDGLPTARKLEMLSLERGLPRGLHKFINDMKQQYTMEMIHALCKPVFAHEYALSKLRAQGYRMAVCSNSIRPTIELMMEKSGLNQYLDAIVSAQDVPKGKPDPAIYNKGMELLSVTPTQCLILEDNENGIKAAVASGGHLMRVNSVADVAYHRIIEAIKHAEDQSNA